MNRNSGLARAVARALPTCAFVLTLGVSSVSLAQEARPNSASAAGEVSADAAEQPRRPRDRRRSAAVSATSPAADTAAAPATADAAPATPPAETVDQRIVCKNVKLTGTKISRRVCGSPDQWAAQERRTTDDAQEAMRQVRDRSSVVVSQPQAPVGGLGGGPN
jgi:hypothetical protein